MKMENYNFIKKLLLEVTYNELVFKLELHKEELSFPSKPHLWLLADIETGEIYYRPLTNPEHNKDTKILDVSAFLDDLRKDDLKVYQKERVLKGTLENYIENDLIWEFR